MKKTVLNVMKVAFFGGLISLYACGGTTENKEEVTTDQTVTTEEIATQESEPVAEETATLDLTKGKEVYDAKCKVCHQENGEGLAETFPPLAKSDYLMANKEKALEGILHGQTEKLTVNGAEYSTPMPANELNDEEATAVMNYILNSWGNEGGEVTVIEGKLAE